MKMTLKKRDGDPNDDDDQGNIGMWWRKKAFATLASTVCDTSSR